MDKNIQITKSPFYEWKNKIENDVDKDEKIKEEIKDIATTSKRRYGHKRVTQSLSIQI